MHDILAYLCNTFHVKRFPSPLIGPGLVSTSPATTSNRGTANNNDKKGVALLRWAHEHPKQHRPSLPRPESALLPPTHTPVATFPTSDSSSRTHNRGASEITRSRCSRCSCSGTRGRDPQCAWYQRSFLFSQ